MTERGRASNGAPRVSLGGTLWRAVAERAVATPDAAAVRGPSGSATCAGLAELARAAGRAVAGAGPAVAVRAEASPAGIAAVLGVVAAGRSVILLDGGACPGRDELAAEIADARLDWGEDGSGFDCHPLAGGPRRVEGAGLVALAPARREPLVELGLHEAELVDLAPPPARGGPALVVLDTRPELAAAVTLGLIASGREVHVVPAGLEDEASAAVGPAMLCLPLARLAARGPALLDAWGRQAAGGTLVTWGEDTFAAAALEERLRQADVTWDNLFGFPAPVAASRLRPDALSARDEWVHAGTPLPWVDAEVRDRRGRGVPPGALGTLHVDGRSARLRARLLNSGDLELRDREDGWDCVRGELIAASDVETAVAALPGVAEAAAAARPSPSGDAARLVAYVRSSERPAVERWNELLRTDLPAAVLPVWFVEVAALPLTPDGMVDLDALAAAFPLDGDELARLERELQELVGPARVAIAARAAIDPPEPLDVRELVGGGARARADRPAPSADRSGPPALARGGPLPEADLPPLILPEALDRAAEGGRAVVCVEADGARSELTYAELRRAALMACGGLRRAGIPPGAEVVLQLERNEAFLAGLWACLLGGYVAVPLAVPSGWDDADPATAKLAAVVRMLERPVVLADPEHRGQVAALAEREGLAVEVVALERSAGADPGPLPAPEPGDTALVMTTSGSTGAPKGVPLTHRNVLAMSKAIARLNGYRTDDVSLNWLPLDHVGGVVMFHLRDVLLGCRQVQVATSFVLADPLRWIEELDRHRATVTWAPNFGFALVNREAKRLEGRRFDLTPIRVIPNGGEVVNVETAYTFLRLLAPHGLRPDAIRPGFGMSETSSSIISSELLELGSDAGVHRLASSAMGEPIEPAREADGVAAFAEVGLPAPGIDIRVVDGDDEILHERTVGRVQLRGPQVMPGYYRNPEATRAAFTADGWLVTGDLGFLDGGRLTITGREKDVVIVNGVNYGAEEIEDAVEAVPGVRPAHVAVSGALLPAAEGECAAVFFAPEDGQDPRDPALLERIRDAVIRAVGLTPEVLVPVEPDELPRTSLGKIQRGRLREALEAGRLGAFEAGSAGSSMPAFVFASGWRPRVRPGPRPLEPACALVFGEDDPATTTLVRQLEARGCSCAVVTPAASFEIRHGTRFGVRPSSREDHQALATALEERSFRARHLIHLWSHCLPGAAPSPAAAVRQASERGVYALLALAPALARLATEGAELTVVSAAGLVTGREADPRFENGTLSGLLKSLDAETPAVRVRHLDLDPGPLDADVVLAELEAPGPEGEVAIRGGERMVRRLRRLAPPPAGTGAVEPGGLWLLVGGLGGVGVRVARWLSERHGARLVICGRTPLPPRSDGDRDADDPTVRARARARRELEYAGVEFVYVTADAADADGLRAAVSEGERRFGRRLAGAMLLCGEGTIGEQWATMESHWLAVEARETFERHYRGKVAGALALHQALGDRPEARLVLVSSLNGSFGGSNVGPYASACSFLDTLAAAWRDRPGRTQSVALTMWRGAGMAADAPETARALAAARGFAELDDATGVASLAIALGSPDRHVLIGLDETVPAVAARVEPPAAFQCVDVYAQGGLDDPRAAELLARSGARRISTHAVRELPRLPSGAIDRARLVSVAGEGDGASEPDAAASEGERILTDIWCDVLGRSGFGLHDDFFTLGGDSIRTIQVAARARAAGLVLDPADVFEHKTIARLAAASGEARARGVADQAPVTGPAPLAPIQRWHLGRGLANPDHFNTSLLFELDPDVGADAVRAAARALLEHHDALRLRFEETSDGWRQWHDEPDDRSSVFRSLRDVPASALDAALREAALAEQAAIDIRRGPLFRVARFELPPPRRPLLLVLANHLVVDGYSWRVLVEDLDAALAAGAAGTPVALPPKTASFKDWATEVTGPESLARHAGEVAHWTAAAGAADAELPVDHPGGDNLQRSAGAVTTQLSEADTRILLDEAPRWLAATSEELLVAAAAWALTRWTGSPAIRLELERHGRDGPVDVARTVGWMTALYPVVLDLAPAAEPLQALAAVGSALGAVPAGEDGYGVLRYLGEDATRRRLAGPPPQVSFNYLGQFDADVARASKLRLLPRDEPDDVAGENERPHVLEIVAGVLEGRLRIVWKYSAGLHRPKTVEALARRCDQALRELLAEAARVSRGEGVDAALAGVDRSTVERIGKLVEFAE